MSSTRLERLARLRRTVGFRLAAWQAGFLLAGGMGILFLAYAALAASLRDGDRAVVVSELQELAAAYRAGGADGLRAEAAAQRLLPQGQAYVGVVLPDGTAAALLAPAAGRGFDLSRLGPAPSGPGVFWSRAGSPDDEDALEIASERLPDGAVLRAGLTTAVREAFLERFRVVVAAFLLPLALLAAGGGVLLTHRVLAPLRELIVTIRDIESGALDARVEVRGTGDELDALSALFNRMVDTVAALMAGMRGALDDVAHDLRTPLTRLRGGAEVALSGGDAAAQREALAAAIEESDVILAMLDGIMDVAEAEAGAMRLRLEDVDVVRLLGDTVELYAPAAEEKGLRLTASAPPGLRLRADRARLRRALANLVDNAVKYVPRGGRVSLSAEREDGAVVVCVRDDGPGIPPEDLPRVWDRLFRGDRSRSERGLGLGLSLVKAVVEAHGGRVRVDSRPGAGAVFFLRLPDAGA